MTAATVAIRDQLLAVLRDAEGFPLSTLQVCEQAGPMAWPPDAVTWRHLAALAAAGRVERVKVPGFRTVYWRSA